MSTPVHSYRAPYRNGSIDQSLPPLTLLTFGAHGKRSREEDDETTTTRTTTDASNDVPPAYETLARLNDVLRLKLSTLNDQAKQRIQTLMQHALKYFSDDNEVTAEMRRAVEDMDEFTTNKIKSSITENAINLHSVLFAIVSVNSGWYTYDDGDTFLKHKKRPYMRFMDFVDEPTRATDALRARDDLEALLADAVESLTSDNAALKSYVDGLKTLIDNQVAMEETSKEHECRIEVERHREMMRPQQPDLGLDEESEEDE